MTQQTVVNNNATEVNPTTSLKSEVAKPEVTATGRSFQQLVEATVKGQTLKDFSTLEQKVYLEGLMKGSNITLSKTGEIVAPKLGQVEIETVSVKGKKYNVKLYATENGQVHFQGAPGTSKQYGRTLSVQEIEFYFTNFDKIVEWIDANESLLTRMNEEGKLIRNGKEVVKQ